MSLQELFGIALPIIQAPMAGAQGSAMAIAVSNAGGLGSLPCAMLSPEAMRKELAAIKAATDKPFNVNFFCHTQPDPDAAAEARWRQAMTPFYREYGIDPAGIPTGPGRNPFSAEVADILREFSPPVVSFHFGLPSDQLMEQVRSMGSKIIASATTVDEALWLQERGVDAIIAQGLEAGGHRGIFLTDDLTTQVGTFALVRQVAQAVKVPVIAAGGIADAAGVTAAIALGAAGVQVGTAYLLCPESTISAIHREALASPAARHTALTNLFTGRPARGIVNRVMRELGPVNDQVPAFPLATSAIAPLRAKAEAQGSGDFSPLWSGENATGCAAVSAAEITKRLAAGL
ncbi:nitronate monooxygenase [Massilia solisilvae]|uniref:Propionate 3-nitronate monooxygenase n=1 Tax=Massilia solisilvae TaxID=1811225 RepID=A0ABT2BIZ0_9BURK|nr:nitronate monooxygenase [Massilia solisilvae]MCS0608386.1 nitronate monooxygenase [Massilia solisilvae]